LGLASIDSTTKLGLAGEQTKQILGVSQDQTNALEAYLATIASVSHDSTNASFQLDQHALDLIQSGALNKGGEGGQNQTQAFGAIFGQKLNGSNPETLNSQLSGFGNLFAGIGKGIGAAFGG